MNNEIQTPSFWKWNEWTEFWPKAKQEYIKDKSLFDISECSEEFQKEWNNTLRMLDLLLDQTKSYQEKKKLCVSVSKLKFLSESIERWSKQAESSLTFPPTMKGFNLLINNSIIHFQNLKEDKQTFNPMFYVLAMTRAEHVSYSLEKLKQEDKLISDDLLILENQKVWKKAQNAKKNVNTTELKENKHTKKDTFTHNTIKEKQPTVNNKQESKNTYQPKIYSSYDSVNQYNKIITSWLREIELNAIEHKSPVSIQKQMLNEFIKKDAIKHKGTGEKNLNYWFEDLGFPAITTMPLKDLKTLITIWPENFNISWNNPSTATEKPLLWNTFNQMDNSKKQFLLKEFLPHVVSFADWTTKQRFDFLKNIINTKPEPTKEQFHDRLKLWLALGGDLQEEIQAEENKTENLSTSAFSPIEMKSAYSIIKEKHNNGWTDVTDFFNRKEKSTLRM